MGRIAVILVEGYADWECAYLCDAGRRDFGLDMIVASPAGRSVVSQGGVMTVPHEPMEQVSPVGFDMLVLCGGAGWEENDFPDVADLARLFLNKERRVAAICGATLALARIGALDGRDHTSNSLDYLKSRAPDYCGERHFRKDPLAIACNGVITAPGCAPAHFAAEVFRAAGVARGGVADFLGMAAAEHLAARKS